MKKPIAAVALTALLLSLSGCGYSGLGPVTRSAQTVVALDSEPTTKEAFLKAVADRGVKLSAQQLQIVAAGRTVQPNGQFASRPAANLTSEQNLDVHFKKHGHEFNPPISSADQYRQQAVDLAAGKRGAIKYLFDTTSFDKGYQSNVVRWNPQTKEMTAVRPDGAVTTYYRNFSLSPKRFIVVPAF